MARKSINIIIYKFVCNKECFPVIKTRVSSRDPPFLSQIVKHLLKLNKNAVNKRVNEYSPRLQEKNDKLIQLKAIQLQPIMKRMSQQWELHLKKISCDRLRISVQLGRGNHQKP